MDMLRVFYAPAKAMRNVLEEKKFPWMVFIISLLYPNIGVIMNFDATRQLLLTQLKTQFAATGVEMSATALASMMTTTMYVTMASTIVMTFVQWVVFSFILNFIAGFYDSERSFKSIFAMVGYANLIQGLTILILAILMRLGYEKIDLSLLMLLPQPEGGNMILTGLLQSISLFRIWKYVVIGIGLSYCVEERSSAVTVTIIMFALSTAATVVPLMFLPR